MAIILHPHVSIKQEPNYNFILRLEDKLVDVYIGNKETREKVFDYIIEISNENESYPELSYTVRNILSLQYNDSSEYIITKEIDMITTFINTCYNGTLLIHCGEGISRSPSILIMYLIHFYSYTYKNAYDMISFHRYIKPNKGFVKQLQRFSSTA
jgi:predicted protein tyrosine phosphatase